MQMYRDWDNDSNVLSYDIGDDFIVVEFKSGRFTTYTYTYTSAGSYNVDQMKRLAANNDGLNSFISLHKPQYESRR